MKTTFIFNDYQNWLQQQQTPAGKRKVLLAALKLFAQKGYDQTYTGEIAAVSGMSEATIFKYFKTKDSLLLEIVKPIIENLFPEWGQVFREKLATQQTDLQELVHFIVQDRFAFLSQNVAASMIIFNEVMTNQPVINLLEETLQTRLKTTFSNTFAALQATTDFDQNVTLPELAQIFIGQLVTYFLQCYKFHTADLKDTATELAAMEKRIYRAISID